MKNYFPLISMFIFIALLSVACSQNKQITHDLGTKTILVSDESQDLTLMIDYSDGCKITQVKIKGENTVSPSGVFTAVKIAGEQFSSDHLSANVKVSTGKGRIEIGNISYGNGLIHETWIFKPEKNSINWTIRRKYTQDVLLEDMAFPVWNFTNLSVWKGGIFDNGGMVWCKYLRRNSAYGVHTAGVTFWNPDNNLSFRVAPIVAKALFPAAKYMQTEVGEFACWQYVTEEELGQSHQQERFVNRRTDVFAPFNASKGEISISLDLQSIDYATEYSRGDLRGIDAVAVRELLNTTGRYGVVDNNIIGANGWTTNWKCLHEPFFAQIGMAVNDKNYTRNFSSTLDQERELAMLEDGRVLSRWHGVRGDEIPGTYDEKTGYYEAKWGYTVDSQTGYIINTAEQFDLCGDINWLKSHKESCEKALEWLIKRDSNNNGIFEMVNNNISEEKCSDWIDIVWAGFENAFVNAQMYEALQLWADCEEVLGDGEKAEYYREKALRLKNAFNQTVDQGGFWYPEKKQYIYWRDDDGSIHGDNLVTPVNFAAIAFGICDDPCRIAQILNQIEERTVAEQLFHWPLCFDSFKREEVHINNWPFPKYENGDIFPTWGYLGIRAYVAFDKEIALKYIRNILDQYNTDGLSSQRYSRITQQGLGSDILAGISTTVTALYRDIYGVRPKWNRMGLEPNMLNVLNGTSFTYTLRDTLYHLKLSVNDYEMSAENFSIKSGNAFGASMRGNTLYYYPDNRNNMVLGVTAKSKPVRLEMDKSEKNEFSWKVTSKGKHHFTITGLDEKSTYQLTINDQPVSFVRRKNGDLSFSYDVKEVASFRLYWVCVSFLGIFPY